jgi:hypothetical protein
MSRDACITRDAALENRNSARASELAFHFLAVPALALAAIRKITVRIESDEETAKVMEV